MYAVVVLCDAVEKAARHAFAPLDANGKTVKLGHAMCVLRLHFLPIVVFCYVLLCYAV
jgi:hypothetical protein